MSTMSKMAGTILRSQMRPRKISRLQSRFLTSNCSNVSKVANVSFKDGFFKFNLDNKQFLVSFWTPIDQVAALINPEANVAILDMNNEPVAVTKDVLSLGKTLADSSVLQVTSNQDQNPIMIKYDGLVGDLRQFLASQEHQQNFDAQVGHSFNPGMTFDLNTMTLNSKQQHVALIPWHDDLEHVHVLEKEKQQLVATYEPLSQQFNHLLLDSESQAQTRFKWGGLFLLSAQLGFFVRCIWWEYSWDIMEPITWCVTYSMMLGTFAYYIHANQEFTLPLVEKRAVRDRLWKNVHKHNFDVEQFKQLRMQLLKLDKKVKKAKSEKKQIVFSTPFDH